MERDSSYTVSKRILIENRAVDDPPSVSLDSTFYAPMGERAAIAEIETTDWA